MNYEIIIRDSKNNELVRQVVPKSCLIAVLEVEDMKLDGWKKKNQVWCNLSEEEKRRMLEHSTFENNEDI